MCFDGRVLLLGSVFRSQDQHDHILKLSAGVLVLLGSGFLSHMRKSVDYKTSMATYEDPLGGFEANSSQATPRVGPNVNFWASKNVSENRTKSGSTASTRRRCEAESGALRTAKRALAKD